MIFLSKSFSNTKISSTLIHLGAHIGDLNNYKHFDHNSFFNVLCIRNDYYIFDLSKTSFFLQRALFFILKLSSKYGKLLFYHSSIDSYFLKFIYFFLIRFKTVNSFLCCKFKGGYFSNYKKCFIRFINILSNIPMRARIKRRDRKKKSIYKVVSRSLPSIAVDFISSYKYRRLKKQSDTQRKKKLSFSYNRYLFSKLILITYHKSILKRDWYSESLKIKSFWKSFVFIRSFKSVFNLPDCLISINPSNDWSLISEYSNSRKIPSVGILDTSSIVSNCTYIIPSNDDSIPLALFYTSLFLNIWFIGYHSAFKLPNTIFKL